MNDHFWKYNYSIFIQFYIQIQNVYLNAGTLCDGYEVQKGKMGL